MATLSPSQLTITAADTINETITVSAGEGESVSNVACTRNPEVITTGINFEVDGFSINFTGNYTGPFAAQGVFVTKGESDKTEEHPIGTEVPTTVYGTSSIPPYEEVDLFKFNQLAQSSVTLSNAFIINIETDVGSSTLNLDVVINSNYVSGYNFLRNYFP